jgi:hypothetical protein
LLHPIPTLSTGRIAKELTPPFDEVWVHTVPAPALSLFVPTHCIAAAVASARCICMACQEIPTWHHL